MSPDADVARPKQERWGVAGGLIFVELDLSGDRIQLVADEGRSAERPEIEEQHSLRPVTEHVANPSAPLSDPEQLAGLQAYIVKHNIGLVFIGPLAQVGNLEDENKVEGISQICKNLNQIITATGATIFLIHHRKKTREGTQYGSVNSFFETSRGSSALTAAVDVAIGLERGAEETDGKMFVLLRDGTARVEHYTFDFTTLRLTIRDGAPPNARERNIAAVQKLLYDDPTPYTRRQIHNVTKVADSTLSRLLSDLCEDGHLTKVGTNRSTTYVLHDDFRANLDRSPKTDLGAILAGEGEETA